MGFWIGNGDRKWVGGEKGEISWGFWLG